MVTLFRPSTKWSTIEKSLEMKKHEIHISRNKVNLHGIWAWLFIGLGILKFITLILWAISALLKMIILFI